MFENRRRLYIIIGIIIIFLLGVIGYLLTRQPPPQRVAEAIPVEITWWQAGPGNQSFKDIIKDFSDIPGNEAVSINYEEISYNNGSEYYYDLILGFARGDGPDIFTLDSDDIPAYQEFLTPLSNVRNIESRQFISDSQLLADYQSDFTDLVIRQTVDKDQIFGITSYVDNLQLYYNQTLLEQNGIAKPPATWKELDTQLNSLNRRSLQGDNFSRSAISLGTGLDVDNGDLAGDSNISKFYEILPALIMQAGGQIYDEQANKVVFGNNRNQLDVQSGQAGETGFNFEEGNPTLDALNFYLSFAEQNSNRYSWSLNSDNNIDKFARGELAYILEYRGFEENLLKRNPRLRFGVAEIPQIDSNFKKTFGNFFVQVLNRKMELDTIENSKDLVAKEKLQKAREFLYYLSTRQAQEKFASETRLPGARKDVIEQQVQGDDKLRIFARGSLYADNYYKPSIQQTKQIWGDMLYRIHYENMTPEESLRTAIGEYSLLVSRGARVVF